MMFSRCEVLSFATGERRSWQHIVYVICEGSSTEHTFHKRSGPGILLKGHPSSSLFQSRRSCSEVTIDLLVIGSRCAGYSAACKDSIFASRLEHAEENPEVFRTSIRAFSARECCLPVLTRRRG